MGGLFLAYLESKSVPSQDTLLDSPRCLVSEKPTAKSGRATEAVPRAGVLSGKTKVYNLLRCSFCESYGVVFFSPVDVHWHPLINNMVL